jgi:hypothetical protein
MEVVQLVTTCKTCVHFRNLELSSVRADIWYNHLCMASPLPTKTDPYDGIAKPYGVNDFGNEYFAGHKFKFCRDVNDGKCSKWEKVK